MPVYEKWEDEPCSILQVTINGYWTWDEVIRSAERVRAMCADKTHRMDILVDLLKLTYRPPGAPQNVLHALKELPALLGVELVVFVVNDFMYSLIHPGVGDLVPIPHKFVPGLNEGSDLIERARSGGRASGLLFPIEPATLGGMSLHQPDFHARLFIASGIFHPEPGGPATYLRELLPELQTRGWEPRALTFSDRPDALGEPYPVTRIVRASYPLRTARYAAAARPLLAWADLVYVHLLGLPLFGDRHARRVIKIVGDLAWERAVRRGWIPPTEDIDAYQTQRYGLKVSAGRARLAREARTYDGIIVPSGYLKRMVVGWGVPEERVRVIYNALPPEAADEPDISPAQARALFGLPEGPLVVTIGRLLPWKGVDHLISALARTPEVRLAVAGDGPALAEAQAQAAAAGLTSRVHFLGRVARDKVATLMKAADYVALYSGYEGLSHTLLESLRVGTPVIASDKGGNPEVVQHGVNGLLVPYVNVEALAAALAEAFAPGKRAELAASHHAGMERFEYARLVAATDAALREYL